MSKVPATVFGLFAAGATVLTVNGFSSSHEKEVAVDRSDAALAQAFLGRVPEVSEKIEVLIAKKQAEIDHVAAVVGPDCLRLVLGKKPETIEDITTANDCELDDGALKETKNLYHSLESQRLDLQSFLQVGDFNATPFIERAEHGAKVAIEDAADESMKNDFMDTDSGEPISIDVNDAGDIVTIYQTDESLLADGLPLFGTVVSLCFAACAAGEAREGRGGKNNAVAATRIAQ